MLLPWARRCLILLSAGVFLTAAAAASDDKPPALDCKLSFDDLTRTIATHPDAQRSRTEDWDMVQIASPSTSEKDWWIALYVFTKRDHYAYPTITRKIIWKDPTGKVMTERTACGFGDMALFD
jgi:hypothetical protein